MIDSNKEFAIILDISRERIILSYPSQSLTAIRAILIKTVEQAVQSFYQLLVCNVCISLWFMFIHSSYLWILIWSFFQFQFILI